jgi:hypothetical protein
MTIAELKLRTVRQFRHALDSLERLDARGADTKTLTDALAQFVSEWQRARSN